MNDAEVISLGCRLNAFEGEKIRRLASAAGLSSAVVINSCAVTGEAVRQTRQMIRRARRKNPAAKIIVTGCAAQIDPTSFAAMAEVDAVLGNREKLSAADWRALSASGESVRVNDITTVRDAADHLVDGFGDRSRAFLQVQNGCDHRCTFCVIPYGRGDSRSAPMADIVEAAERLAEAGHAEIVLTGVDITSYGADLPGAPTLGDLVGAILDGAPSVRRLRLSSIDSAEVDSALFARLTGDDRVAPHLHLSLQSGADIILKRMKRRHTRADAIAFCRRVRQARPDIALGADIIVGFPTETDEDFSKSVSLVDEAGLNFVHVFPFSPRAGTPAARMPQLSRAVIRRRSELLRAKGQAVLTSFLDGLVGREFDAVIESGGRARLGNFAPVKLTAPAGAAGAIARLSIIARDDAMLLGEPLLERR
ncbi:MAG TPA: tRNA (N(6)-L-threonylcarbamoyladenosine(37)-C(2))-methylthiotransferase MtaB [Parvularculaceae bacterium]|nr:tRNA (N(6)-L-threonylcarbamoyladenosine(37)-C(2))-methylthiotransferase MtaB [Parvularculaceae bacterium]